MGLLPNLLSIYRPCALLFFRKSQVFFRYRTTIVFHNSNTPTMVFDHFSYHHNHLLKVITIVFNNSNHYLYIQSITIIKLTSLGGQNRGTKYITPLGKPFPNPIETKALLHLAPKKVFPGGFL